MVGEGLVVWTGPSMTAPSSEIGFPRIELGLACRRIVQSVMALEATRIEVCPAIPDRRLPGARQPRSAFEGKQKIGEITLDDYS